MVCSTIRLAVTPVRVLYALVETAHTPKNTSRPLLVGMRDIFPPVRMDKISFIGPCVDPSVFSCCWAIYHMPSQLKLPILGNHWIQLSCIPYRYSYWGSTTGLGVSEWRTNGVEVSLYSTTEDSSMTVAVHAMPQDSLCCSNWCVGTLGKRAEVYGRCVLAVRVVRVWAMAQQHENAKKIRTRADWICYAY